MRKRDLQTAFDAYEAERVEHDHLADLVRQSKKRMNQHKRAWTKFARDLTEHV